MADIFISHASGDQRAAKRLADLLAGAGYSVWWDHNLAGGAEFSKEIEQQLDAAKAVVVIWSEASVDSNWVRDEAGLAAKANKLVAVSLGGARPPIGFKQYHAISIDNYDDETTNALLTSVALKLNREPPPSSGHPFTAPRIRLAIAVTIVVLVGVLAVVLPRFREQPAANTSVASSSAAQYEPNTIAVLPFEDFSPGRDQEYFADGIAEELLNVLAQVEGLRVTSRTSAFSFKNKSASVEEIADALKVAHVLEGSVRKAGDTLRITAQLINTNSDEHVWSKTYDREFSAADVFAIQDEISSAIVREMAGRLDAAPIITVPQTTSIEAYDSYLRGRALVERRTVSSINEGIEELKRAVAADPDFAPTHAALVKAYVLAFSYANIAGEDAYALAAPHAARALALAPDAPESLAGQGHLLSTFKDDDRGALVYFDRAIAANPSFAEAHRLRGLALSTLMRIDQAREAFETARRLDPLSPIILANLHRVYWDIGDLDAMLEISEANWRLNPNSPLGPITLGDTMIEMTDYGRAHSLYKEAEQIAGAALRGLANLYFEIERLDLITQPAGAELRAKTALLQSNLLLAREAADDIDLSPARAAVLRWAGDRDGAYRLAKQDIVERELLSSDVQIAVRDQAYDLYYLELLEAFDDPDTNIIRSRLAERFDASSPADFQMRESLYAGAVWRMLNNDRKGALEWLDALLEGGHLAPEAYFEPLFDPLRGTLAFDARLSRMAEIAKLRREEIEQALEAQARPVREP